MVRHLTAVLKALARYFGLLAYHPPSTGLVLACILLVSNPAPPDLGVGASANYARDPKPEPLE
ncbi:hypothetical protein K457DRAFT_23342 [Linnemannia elongata AG-77]|uniref:Uncharacterized protein n=1 Tax=Linnemannia elongata AG-77 TaxID=1314771 RepID=A0A197JL74_9FUNG|nr:hypothetical protein K457DRAFT_23342 [Linnemannia elongata AG-77]